MAVAMGAESTTDAGARFVAVAESEPRENVIHLWFNFLRSSDVLRSIRK